MRAFLFRSIVITSIRICFYIYIFGIVLVTIAWRAIATLVRLIFYLVVGYNYVKI